MSTKNKKLAAHSLSDPVARVQALGPPPLPEQPRRWDLNNVLLWMLCGYLVLLPVSDFILHRHAPGAASNELKLDRGRFVVASALTLSGFQTGTGIDNYTSFGKFYIFLLTLVGSIFTMAFAGLAVARIVRLRYSDGQIVIGACVSCCALVLVGAIPLLAPTQSILQRLFGSEMMIVGALVLAALLALFATTPGVYSRGRAFVAGFLAAAAVLVLLSVPTIGFRRPAIEAFMLSASAFGNSGLFFGQLPGMMSWQLHVIILPAAILGSLGLPVLMEIFDAIRRRGPLSEYSRRVLKLTAGTYLAAVVLFTLVRLASAQTASPDTSLSTTQEKIRFAGANSIAAINSRTLGLPYAVRGSAGEISFVREFTPLMLWMLIPFMLIGGCPAGTAGGVKITTVAEIFRGVRRSLRGESPGRPFGLAVAALALFCGLALLVFVLLMWTAPGLSPERVLFESVSAVSNVGLSYDQIKLHTPAIDIMSAGMILGRLLPLAMLWWMAQTTTDAELPVG